LGLPRKKKNSFSLEENLKCSADVRKQGARETAEFLVQWRAVTGDAGCPGSDPRAAELVPWCGYAMPGPASVGCFEVMLLLPRFLTTEAPLVN